MHGPVHPQVHERALHSAHATMHFGASWCAAVHCTSCGASQKVHPTCLRAAAKGRPPAFDLTCSLFQTVLSSLARVESVSAEM